MKGRDIVGDVHGELSALLALLAELGYERRSGAWRAPEGRSLVFVGDLVDRGPDLDDTRIGHDGAEQPAHAHRPDAEQESLPAAGELQQRHMMVALARREHRTRLRIETDDTLRAQIGDRPHKIDPVLVNHTDLAGKGSQRHFLYFFWLDANFVHKNRVSG